MIKLVDFCAIGRRIKFYRNQVNLRQVDIAERLNVSSVYISRIECGKSEVSLRRLDEIAMLVNTRLQDLIADVNDEGRDYLQSEINEITKGWDKEKRALIRNIAEAINNTDTKR